MYSEYCFISIFVALYKHEFKLTSHETQCLDLQKKSSRDMKYKDFFAPVDAEPEEMDPDEEKEPESNDDYEGEEDDDNVVEGEDEDEMNEEDFDME